jgi:hypothetical protein
MTEAHTVIALSGAGAGLLAATIGWLTMSKAAVRRAMIRRGLDPQMTADDLAAAPDEVKVEFYDLMTSAGPWAFAVAVFGVGAWVCFMIAIPHFAIYSTAACFAFVGWILNEVRLGRRSFRRR